MIEGNEITYEKGLFRSICEVLATVFKLQYNFRMCIEIDLISYSS